MSNDINDSERNPVVETHVELPATRFPVTISYNNYDLASGMDFLVMKMLQHAQERGNIDMGTLMKTCCVAEEMLPFVQFALADLKKHNMVRVPDDLSKLKPNTPCRNMTIVDQYTDLADSGLIAGETITSDRRMLYCEGWNQVLQNDRSFEMENPFVSRLPDREMLEQFIVDHRGEYCGNLNAEVTSVRIPPARKATDKDDGVMKPQGFSFVQKVTLEFNFDGTFRVSENQGVSAESLARSNKKSRDVLKNVRPDLFELGSRCDRFKRRSWSLEAPAGVETFLLPGHFISFDGLFLHGDNFSDITYEPNLRLPEGFDDCDAILIEERNRAYRYWFTKCPYTVAGLEGEPLVRNAVAVQTVRRDVIDGLLEKVIAKIPTGPKGLETLSMIATQIKDDEIFFSRIREDLAVGNLDKLRTICDGVSELNVPGLKAKFVKALEDTLCHWIRNGCDMDTATRFWDACESRDYRLSGYRFLPVMLQNYPATEVGEWVFGLKNEYGSILASDRVFVALAMETIDSGTEFKAKAPIMKMIERAGRNLATVRRISGILSAKRYHLDMGAISPSDGKVLADAEKELFDDMTRLGKLMRQDSAGREDVDTTYREIMNLLRIFRPVATLYTSKPTTYGPSIVREEVGLVFCRNLMQKLEDALLDLFDIKRPVKTQMAELRKLGKMEMTTLDDLDEFIREHSEITTTDVTRPVYFASRQRYLEAVTAVEKTRRE
ncbi:MAG: hypothetical protein MJZ38_06680 [archaeon]|nr:hypothetical protein [archaeon]